MSIDSIEEQQAMERVGQLVGQTVKEMAAAVRPGMSTADLDAVGAAIFAREGARSAPQLVYKFPGVNCISLNDEAVHGIPGPRTIKPGDLVKIDVTAELDGYMADAATTVAVAPATAPAKRIAACAETAFNRAMDVARAGQPLYAIGRAIETEVRRQGFNVIPELRGHGIGRTIHEAPFVPQNFDRRAVQRLREGMVITIEPIIAAGSPRIVTDRDGWTIRTVDGGLSAHFEHTVVITRGRPIILTGA